MKKCRVCNIELRDENWIPSNQKQGNYMCNKHYNEYKKQLKEDHKNGIKRRPEKNNLCFYPDKDGFLVAKLPLTQKEYAIIDIYNLDKLSQYEWQLDKGRNTNYAKRKIYNKKTKKVTSKFMHHDVISLKEGLIVDHIDHNGLNNKESNLRNVTTRENAQNHKRKDYTSKYPGVCWDKSHNKWMAYMTINGKNKTLGRFDSEKLAYKIYKENVKRVS